MSIEALQQYSASHRELVLSLPKALEALAAYEAKGVKVQGWEGWLRYPDGRLGHSRVHQGTAGGPWERPDLARTMQEAQAEHDREPERPGTELLFSITAGA